MFFIPKNKEKVEVILEHNNILKYAYLILEILVYFCQIPN